MDQYVILSSRLTRRSHMRTTKPDDEEGNCFPACTYHGFDNQGFDKIEMNYE